MIRSQVIEKLEILADAAKYDVSCASSGSRRQNTPNGLGNGAGYGICHSYTEDGRCVSLLKILFTNHCIYDCAYCVSRRSNDVRRVAFTVADVVELTLGFYRRNYIEGLFLSSGIFKDADTTSERLVEVARVLREEHAFNGYIHLKVIPGTSQDLLDKAGRFADRLSVNLEIPSEEGLRMVAPEKDYASVITPMGFLNARIRENKDERKSAASAPAFAPGGQSTQLVVGATPEPDSAILRLAEGLYSRQGLRRVYYSGYVPVSEDARVPALRETPRLREHRLYQADWLMRFYGFEVEEIIADRESLDLDIDPKLAYALRNPGRYPVDVNRASLRELIRVPGLGRKSGERIVQARRFGRVRITDLRRFGVNLRTASYFIETPDHRSMVMERGPEWVRAALTQVKGQNQMDLFA
jgi:putative DNA modification/repair radical SAM protein